MIYNDICLFIWYIVLVDKFTSLDYSHLFYVFTYNVYTVNFFICILKNAEFNILKGVTISISIYKVWLQLKQWFQGEAHWAGPVSLTFHSDLRKLP
jgi:hypothetical protein